MGPLLQMEDRASPRSAVAGLIAESPGFDHPFILNVPTGS